MPIHSNKRLFVYGFEHDGHLLYIGKSSNLLSRFKNHCGLGGCAFSFYLRHLLKNNECPYLIIFGYHEERIADYLERLLIRNHSKCKYLLNQQLREVDFKNSQFVKFVYSINDADDLSHIKIPKYIIYNLIKIQENYRKRYATIEEPRR